MMNKIEPPVWVIGAETAAPGALTQLVRVIPSPGKLGFLFGARIVSQEVNAAGKVWRVRASIQGQTLNLVLLDITNPSVVQGGFPIGVIKGNGVDFFEMVNVVAATASTIHQGSLLYAEQTFAPPVVVTTVEEQQ